MTVRTVVFDFGNVIGFFSHRRAAEQLAKFARVPTDPDEVFRFLFATELESRFEVGRVSPADLLATLRREFDLGGTDAELSHAFADIFAPNEAVCGLIPELQGRVRLALLSNTNDLHYRVLRRQFADTLDRFDYLFTSHEVGLRKPDPELFTYITKRVGGEPGEFLFVDDLAANVDAACAHGWRGVLYTPSSDLRQQLSQVGVIR